MAEKVSDTPSVVFITGATASGKSEVGLQVAQCLDGEIVCIDSRTVYEGMDIGTAKPTKEEQALVPHHLIDITTVNNPLSASGFQEKAHASIADIISRGRLPVLIGGASLYGDAVLYEFAHEDGADRRERFESFTVQDLKDLLREQSIPLPFNRDNRRDLLGYAQLYAGAMRIARLKVVRIGIEADRNNLVSKIEDRTQTMMDAGLESEVQGLVEQYGWGPILSSTIGYREFRQYFEGKTSLNAVVGAIIANTVELADYQTDWFRRYEDTLWVRDAEAATNLIKESSVLAA